MKEKLFIALVSESIGEELANEIAAAPMRGSLDKTIEKRYAVAYANIMARAEALGEASDQECLRGNVSTAVDNFKEYEALLEALRYMEVKFQLLHH